MTMTGQSHEADLHRSTEAFNQGDVAMAMKLFAPDVTFVVPGRSPLAGTYTGRDHVVQFFSKLHELSGGTFRIAVDDVVAKSGGWCSS